MVTTEHTGEMVDSGKVYHVTNEPIMKPNCVIDCNKNMRLVDKQICKLVPLNVYDKQLIGTRNYFFILWTCQC